MLVTIIGTDSEGFNSFTVQRGELAKIEHPDVKVVISDRPGTSGITYWLSIGNYVQAREKGGLGPKNLVLFNPSGGWRDAERNMEYCVYSSKKYYDTSPVVNKYLIPPGIDLELFKPDIKIGVVAIYRPIKGENILKEIVFDEEVTKYFSFHIVGPRWEGFKRLTGAGVPQPKYYGSLPYNEMPRFYNAMDYILIPTNPIIGEGGPFPIIEAFACGKPVITTDVGYAGELNTCIFHSTKHLKAILQNIVDRFKTRYWRQISELTWDKFKENHIKAFINMGA